MRILQLSKKLPFPIKDGESMAITSLAQSLNLNGITIDILSLNTLKHRYLGKNNSIQIPYYKSVSWIDIDTNFNILKLVSNLFSNIPYQISRFYNHKFKKKLIEFLKSESYDIIILETIYLLPYIPTIKKFSDSKIFLRSHNLEFEIWSRLADGVKFGLKKWIYSFLSKQIKKFESTQIYKIDGIIAISERELKEFKIFHPNLYGIVIPITWKNKFIELKKINTRNELKSLCFIGSLDWRPNIEGLLWFLHEIWPPIKKEFPDLNFYVAGRNMPDYIKNRMVKGVFFIGEVKDSTEFVLQHDICIVPILSGSGMRAKIIEGMALGKTVITTTLGLEGIKGTNGLDLFIANNSEEFFNIIRKLIFEPDLLHIIGINAQKTVKELYGSEENGRKLVKFLTQTINSNS